MAAPQPVASPPRHGRNSSLGARSEKSHRSTPSANNKLHLTESHEDKVKRNLHTKADPMLAMNEAQPSMCHSIRPVLISTTAFFHMV